MPNSHWQYAAALLVEPDVPTGLIVPFLDTVANIPSQWTQWKLASDTIIRGDTSNGNTGGSTDVTATIAEGGGHSGGTAFYAHVDYNNTLTGTGRRNGAVVGAHTHTGTLAHTPAIAHLVFIEATADQVQLPINTGVLADSTISGLTDATETGKILGVAYTTESLDAAASSLTSVSSAGNHHHQCCLDGFDGVTSTNYAHQPDVSHDHTLASITITESIQRYYMGVWTSASAKIPLEDGMYAMWESATAPAKYALCDGTGGTPDLTDCFIGFDTTKLGNSTGDNTLSATAGLTNSVSHQHQGASQTSKRELIYHSSSVSHDHAVTVSSTSYEPPHYTLVFIKYIG